MFGMEWDIVPGTHSRMCMRDIYSKFLSRALQEVDFVSVTDKPWAYV